MWLWSLLLWGRWGYLFTQPTSYIYIFVYLSRENFWYLKVYGLLLNCVLNITIPLFLILLINIKVYRSDTHMLTPLFVMFLFYLLLRSLTDNLDYYQSVERRISIRIQQEECTYKNYFLISSIFNKIIPVNRYIIGCFRDSWENARCTFQCWTFITLSWAFCVTLWGENNYFFSSRFLLRLTKTWYL